MTDLGAPHSFIPASSADGWTLTVRGLSLEEGWTWTPLTALSVALGFMEDDAGSVVELAEELQLGLTALTVRDRTIPWSQVVGARLSRSGGWLTIELEDGGLKIDCDRHPREDLQWLVQQIQALAIEGYEPPSEVEAVQQQARALQDRTRTES